MHEVRPSLRDSVTKCRVIKTHKKNNLEVIKMLDGQADYPRDGEGDFEFTPEEKEAMWGEELARSPYDVYCLRGERVRRYIYPDGEVVIDDPQELFITRSGSHRVIGPDGWVSYIPRGWKVIQWLPRDPSHPVSF